MDWSKWVQDLHDSKAQRVTFFRGAGTFYDRLNDCLEYNYGGQGHLDGATLGGLSFMARELERRLRTAPLDDVGNVLARFGLDFVGAADVGRVNQIRATLLDISSSVKVNPVLGFVGVPVEGERARKAINELFDLLGSYGRPTT